MDSTYVDGIDGYWHKNILTGEVVEQVLQLMRASVVARTEQVRRGNGQGLKGLLRFRADVNAAVPVVPIRVSVYVFRIPCLLPGNRIAADGLLPELDRMHAWKRVQFAFGQA